MGFLNIKKVQKRLDIRFGGNVHIADTGYSFRLTGTVDTWNQVVEAGAYVCKSGSKKHIVNDITVPDLEKPCVIQPKISDAALEEDALMCSSSAVELSAVPLPES